MPKKYDAILIPGGGLKKNGQVPLWTKRRLDKALELSSGKEYLIPLSIGTVHKPPPKDKKGFPVTEAGASADYLAKKNYPKQKILLEKFSLDTIGNAYFTRVIITDPLKLKKLLIITSDFHLPRTEAIFKWVYNLKPAPVKYRLDFLGVSDKGMNKEITQARIRKEKQSLIKLNQTKRTTTTLPKLTKWLFTKHTAYACGLKSKPINNKLLSGY